MNPGSVVLIDSGWPQTLYLIESLLKSNFNLIIISTDNLPNYLAGRISSIKVEDFNSHEFIEQIGHLFSATEVKWIIPLNEEAIQVCHSKYSKSSKLYPPISDSVINLLSSKHVMAEFALNLGIPVPEFIQPLSEISAVEISNNWGYPIVVKGLGGFGGSQVSICENAEEVLSSYLRFSEWQPIVQKFIKGNTWVAGGFFVNGQAIRLHICEALELDPPGRGISVMVRNCAPNDLKEHFVNLCLSLNWNGFACADFVQSAEGEFFFMEINPRPWSAMTSAFASGIDIFTPLSIVLKDDNPVADLNIVPGWSGHVFPAYLRSLAQHRNYFGLFVCLLSPSFWRGVPRSTFGTFYYLVKQAYWILRK